MRLAEGRFPLVDRLSTSLNFHGLKWEAPVQVEARHRLEHVNIVRGGRMYRPWLGWDP